MTSTESSGEHTNQRATDTELFAILRGAEKNGIPALVTSQFNEIGEYGYSSTGLNERLMNLHEDGIIGHQKAGNRHMWWLSGEGTTESTELSSLEEIVNYEELDPEKFSKEQATEIAEVAIPGYKKNWWQRVYLSGDDLFRPGGGLLFISFGFFAVNPTLLPDSVLAIGLIVGLVLILGAFWHYIVGYLGELLTRYTDLPEEPWGGENLTSVVFHRIRKWWKSD